MNKAELISAIAEKTGLSKTAAAEALDAGLDAITAAVAAHDSVSITGFGTLAVKKREARTGRNPKTNEPIEIPASFAPVFKPGKNLKVAANG